MVVESGYSILRLCTDEHEVLDMDQLQEQREWTRMNPEPPHCPSSLVTLTSCKEPQLLRYIPATVTATNSIKARTPGSLIPTAPA